MDVISHFVRFGQMSENTVCPSKFLAFLLKILLPKNKPEIEGRPVSYNCYAIIVIDSLSNKEQQGVHHHWQQLWTVNLSFIQNETKPVTYCYILFSDRSIQSVGNKAFMNSIMLKIVNQARSNLHVKFLPWSFSAALTFVFGKLQSWNLQVGSRLLH